MQKGFTAQLAERNAKRMGKWFAMIWIILIFCSAFLYLLPSLDEEFAEASGNMTVYLLIVMGFVFLCSIVVFIRLKAKGRQSNYNKLRPHSADDSAEVVGRAIDAEAAQGKILADEFINGNKTGDRIVLLPSYLLLNEETRGTITVIPVDKIFWICAQPGISGVSDYSIRLKVFAEGKMYNINGIDNDHVTNIADKIYRYIPNIFHNYDVFDLSYKLEEAFTKDYNGFVEFYQKHKAEFVG